MADGDISRERPTTHIEHSFNLACERDIDPRELHERRHQNLGFEA
jgi:hypothetical protein